MSLEAPSPNKFSPTFYTGCSDFRVLPTNISPICQNTTFPKLSPEDFINMQNSLYLISSSESPNFGNNYNITTSNFRRTLLPLPDGYDTSYADSEKSRLIKKTDVNANSNKSKQFPDTMNYSNQKPKKPRRLFQDDDDNQKTTYIHEQGHSGSSTSLNISTPSPISTSSGDTLHLNNEYRHTRNNEQVLWNFSYKSPNTDVRTVSRKRKEHSPSPEERKKVFRPNPSSSDVWDQLTSDIWNLYDKYTETPEVFQKKMNLRQHLHDVLLSTFPRCGLYVVGSSMTGFATTISDMDMCLMITDDEIDQQTEARNLLIDARRALMRCNFIHYVEFIPAKVPILKFRDSLSFIEVDLNINNSTGIRNTQLLNSYSRIDKRVAPLVLVVKMWAKEQNINDAKYNTLSSYSLVLMVLHYLQCGCYPPVVPCLQQIQPEKFNPSSKISTLSLTEELPNFQSDNSESLGQLFVGFMQYFAYQFDFANDVMCIRLGCILNKEIAKKVESPKNKLAHWKYICIEEPFDRTNTACSVFKDASFYFIRNKFAQCYNLLQRRRLLRDVLSASF